jgi:CDP-4-dehydro-6-deoxyglucose reductase
MPGPLTTRLTSRTQVSANVIDLRFGLVDPPRLTFQAGQFLTLAVGRDASGQPVRRSYSLASRSDQGEEARFIIRVIPGGLACDLFVSLPLGTEIEMTGPHGFFVLAPQHPGDLVFGATGTGIAPVIPMLAELAARDEPGRRLVFWGVRNQGDLFLTDEVQAACDAAGAPLCTYLSRPGPGWTGRTGRITQPVLDLLPSLTAPSFYLVGNGAMIAELKKGLVTAGVDRRKQIRTEAFFD